MKENKGFKGEGINAPPHKLYKMKEEVDGVDIQGGIMGEEI